MNNYANNKDFLNKRNVVTCKSREEVARYTEKKGIIALYNLQERIRSSQ